ncbi:amino acid adenylation domain-containing protein [uncultured Bradyrhizobium sp.]|uniref:amino acid adenylation domain-containing protein n=1 Tax=uncultured Bradyrhizobium sp. TaxID=199684 RepID=UPI0035CA2A78
MPPHRDDILDIYPLTPFQEGLLYHDMLGHDAGAAQRPYFQQLIFRMRGPLDCPAFERSWAWLIARHDILRTVFRTGGADRPLQIVVKHRPFRLDGEDLSALTGPEQAAAIESCIQSERARPFDLQRDLLMRVACLTLGATEHLVVWSFHHILVDGWCIGILQRELAAAYADFSSRRQPDLPPAPQFGTHVVLAEKRRGEHILAYWADYLAGYEPGPLLPGHRVQTPGCDASQHRLPIALGNELSERLTALAQREGVTLNILVQALWGVLVAKLNGRRDVVFGAVVSTRLPDLPGSDSMIGPCIVMLPLRVRYQPGDEMRGLLRRLRAQTGEWLSNTHCALADVQARCRTGTALFDHFAVFENYPLDAQFRGDVQQFAPGLTIEDVRSFITTNYDFYLSAQSGARLQLELCFNAENIDPSVASLLAARFCHLATKVADDVGCVVDAVPILFADEAEQILQRWSHGAAPAPLAPSVAAARARLLTEGGTRPALRVGDRVITHSELQEAAEAAARGLHDRFAIRPGNPVAVWAVPNEDTVVAMLACLLLGAPFVPLDAAAPAARNIDVLADCGARLMIATGQGKMPELGVTTVTVAELATQPGGALQQAPEVSAAYIIYTSGTTGTPKGVQVGQAALLNYAGWLARDLGITAADRTALVTSAAYDLGYTGLFGSLLLGGCLSLIGEDERRDPQHVIEIFRSHRLSWLKATPSFLSMLLTEAAELSAAQDLRLVLLGGEPQRFADLRRLKETLPGVTIFNHYGPTEATIGCIAGRIDDDLLADRDPPQRLGRPIAGAQVILCDQAMMPVPPGTPGELIVAGAGLADRYVGAGGRDAERFVNPACLGGVRAYRTGDWGEWLADGSIAFHGRRDDQIKVRGHRVTLGGIERVLAGIAGIRECAVVAETSAAGETELIAFVVPKPGSTLSAADLRTALSANLPEPMVPSRFVLLSRLPLTTNGKVDRAALRADGVRLASVAAPMEQTGNDLEEALRRIWADVLFVEQIGLDDDFFDLGGHSIKAVLLVSRVRKQLKRPLVIRELFEHPTVRLLARHMAGARGASDGLLTLRSAPTGAPAALFLPPVLGSSTVYRELIGYFGADLACYGAQCPGFDREENIMDSLSALADLFAGKAATLGHTSPLRLVGWSMGAHLALETALRLERAGRSLRLVLIDSPPRLPESKPCIDDEPPFANFEELARQPYWAGVFAKLFASLSAEERNRLERLGVQNRQMLQDYVFTGNVAADLFCIEALDNAAPAGMGSFGTVTSGRCVVQRVAGDHYSMFQPPNLEGLAQRVESALMAT